MKLPTITWRTWRAIDILLNSWGGPVNRKSLAHLYEDGYFSGYTASDEVLLLLMKAGILKSKRGRSGGYMLERPLESITVWEVSEAVETAHDPVRLLSTGSAELLTYFNHKIMNRKLSDF